MDRIVFLALAGAAVSCVSIDGGAVEASWVVRSDDGRAITECTCAAPEIARVRLSLVGAGIDNAGMRPCQDRASCEFPCARNTGATPFDIPPGMYLVSLTPVDVSGLDLSAQEPKVETPAPLLREVVRGQPTQLDALSIVAMCAPSCSGANKGKVCSRQ
jgi:hypothetical protein